MTATDVIELRYVAIRGVAHESVHVTVVKSFEIPVIQKNISVELQFENFVNEEVGCKDLIVSGDKFKICHIIHNLMPKALKFTGVADQSQ